MKSDLPTPCLSSALKRTIEETVSDGTLSTEDMRTILSAALAEAGHSLSRDQIALIMRETDAQLESSLAGKRVPLPLRILGTIIMIVGLASITSIVFAAIGLAGTGAFDLSDAGTVTTLVVEIVLGLVSLASLVISVILGSRLLRNKRRNAARAMMILVALSAASILCTIMIYGIGVELIEPGVVLLIRIALLSFLDPSLIHERQLRHMLRELDTEIRAEKGTLGLDLTGRGYIRLDFFNLFWIFMLGCVLGDLGETIYHMAVVDPGVFQNRTGMLFGPFSPIYGFGGVIMTIALNRFHKRSFVIIFLVSALIGGAFEFFVSWYLETSFGIVAWDYTGTFLSIGGRTNAYFMCIWGVAGTIWVKGLLPLVLWLINRIPWKLRYSVTTLCAALMIANGLMTLQSVDCWYDRVSGKEPTTPVEWFYAENFDDEWMAGHFQSMTITPNGGHQL